MKLSAPTGDNNLRRNHADIENIEIHGHRYSYSLPQMLVRRTILMMNPKLKLKGGTCGEHENEGDEHC